MSRWRSVKAKQLLGALLGIGWEIAWQKGSHRRLKRAGGPNYTFAFLDNEEIGPGRLPQIAKKTGLTPDDL
jgi:predicted RNA binding protein YcfA (HicA-like mRNA interferase family)